MYILEGGKEKKSLQTFLVERVEIVPLGSMIREGWHGYTEVKNGTMTRIGGSHEIYAGTYL